MIRTRFTNKRNRKFIIRTFREQCVGGKDACVWRTLVIGRKKTLDTITSYTHKEACETHLSTCLQYRDGH